ncbi:MAG: DUF2298 domain-containing protein, partial [Candidatus Roizmanbacteria bacterium]
MSWLSLSLLWYIKLFLLGIATLPATFTLFKKIFPDRGYAFAKPLGLILLTYTMYVLGTLKILPFTFSSLVLISLVLIGLQWILLRNIADIQKTFKKAWRLILFSELLSFAGFMFWSFVRAQEPTIRGLEKYMDYGFMNATVRSMYFPTH